MDHGCSISDADCSGDEFFGSCGDVWILSLFQFGVEMVTEVEESCDELPDYSILF